MVFHLSLNLSEFGRHSGAWRHESSDMSEIPAISQYVRASVAAERGMFDQVFIADTPVHAPGSTSVTGTRVDPFVMASEIATATTHIGIIATVSTSYNEPFDVARRAAATDNVLGGRLGVNYVASTGDATARNFHRSEQLPHGDRYRRSNEFVEVVTELWDGSPTDSSPGHTVHHDGEFFQLTGAPDIAQPIGGRPLIVQAGSSPEGRDLAARWADAIYAGGSTLERAQEYYDDIKERAAAYGRDPDDVKILLGIMPFLGETEQDAEDLHRTLDDNHAAGADVIGHLGRLLEIDLSGYDPDGPLPFDDLPEVRSASVSQALLFTRMAREEHLTLAEVAYRSYVGGLANMQFTATGTGVQIADVMEEWYRAGTCDGFAIVAPILPRSIDDFVDLVVPELQRRGLVRTHWSGTTLRDHFADGDRLWSARHGAVEQSA